MKVEEPKADALKHEFLFKEELDEGATEVKSESKESVKKSPSQVLKKRTRKQVKMKRCDFLDFEAEEDDEKPDRRSIKHNEDDYKRGK